MLKTILKLQGAKQLAKTEQQVINGGKAFMMICTKHSDCPPGYCCNEIQAQICTRGTVCR